MIGDEQMKHPIYNGRGVDCDGPPISIYEPIFAHVVDNLDNLANRLVEEDLIEDVAMLFDKATLIYSSVSARLDAINLVLGKILGVYFFNASQTYGHKTAESDAVARCSTAVPHVSAVFAHAQFKNEMGMSGDGELQGALTFRKYVASREVSWNSHIWFPIF